MHETLTFFLSWLLGGFVNNVTGFGAAMVAMPFVATSVPLEIAVPASTLIVLTLNLQLGWNYRRHIKWKDLRFLFAGGVAGTFAGIAFMRLADNDALKRGMGLFMIVFAAHSLLAHRQTQTAPRPRKGMLAGFASTTLGALFGFNGPPLAMYISGSGWPQEKSKAVLGACFIMTGATIAAGQLVAGVHNAQTLTGYAVGCPGALIGGGLGLFMSRFLSPKTYQKILLILITISGIHMALSGLTP